MHCTERSYGSGGKKFGWEFRNLHFFLIDRIWNKTKSLRSLFFLQKIFFPVDQTVRKNVRLGNSNWVKGTRSMAFNRAYLFCYLYVSMVLVPFILNIEIMVLSLCHLFVSLSSWSLLLCISVYCLCRRMRMSLGEWLGPHSTLSQSCFVILSNLVLYSLSLTFLAALNPRTFSLSRYRDYLCLIWSHFMAG